MVDKAKRLLEPSLDADVAHLQDVGAPTPESPAEGEVANVRRGLTRAERMAAIAALLLGEPGFVSAQRAAAHFGRHEKVLALDLRLLGTHVVLKELQRPNGEILYALPGRGLHYAQVGVAERRPAGRTAPAAELETATGGGRIAVAFQLLLGGVPVSAARLAEASGSDEDACVDTLQVLARFVDLAATGEGRSAVYVLRHPLVRPRLAVPAASPPRFPRSEGTDRDRRAADLAAAGVTWADVAAELGFADARDAYQAAERWKARGRWP